MTTDKEKELKDNTAGPKKPPKTVPIAMAPANVALLHPNSSVIGLSKIAMTGNVSWLWTNPDMATTQTITHP